MNHQKPYILIIDDDPDILEALRMVFDAYGYTAKTATNERDLKVFLKKDPPKLIILDYLLSGIDGGVICSSLKSDAATKNIPVIMISAHPDAPNASKDAGADDFMPKPFDISHLLTKIGKYMQV